VLKIGEDDDDGIDKDDKEYAHNVVMLKISDDDGDCDNGNVTLKISW
jgi:hypothetical protein